MKRKIRWLETIELPTLVEATSTDRGKTPKLAKTSFRVFEKGDETPVNVRRDKIHIKRLGAYPPDSLKERTLSLSTQIRTLPRISVATHARRCQPRRTRLLADWAPARATTAGWSLLQV